MSGALDGERLARVRAGEVAALEALYDDYAPYVLGIALRILRDRGDAEEVVQDVFWKLWRHGLRYDALRGRFSTWLFVVARNEALDRLRRRGTRRPDPEPARLAAPDPVDPERMAFLGDRRRAVMRALSALSDRERDAIELAFYEGCSHAEVAERMGEPLGTVKSRIRRAVEKLRDSLAAGGLLP